MRKHYKLTLFYKNGTYKSLQLKSPKKLEEVASKLLNKPIYNGIMVSDLRNESILFAKFKK
jgi:hypothetical protein